MREILFRGKRKDNGMWIYGSLIGLLDGSVYISPVDTLLGYEGLDEMEEVIPETVGQYIGTDDKNGTKVFEGDILDMEYFEGICLVVFDGSSFGYEQKRDLEEDNVYSMPFDDSEYGYLTSGFTIVGNIHDNPELMKTE